MASELLQTLRTADDLLARLQAVSAADPTPVVERTPYPAPAIPPRPARGLSGASVPRILLSLGALCLLVAAVIFLAVAWTWLGIGGRTAVLVGLTAVSGGLGVVLGRRGLRVAAEALTTVSLGLLTLDVIGADNAGWLGDLDTAELVTVVSATLLTAALALSLSTRLVATQLVAVLALSGLGLGVAATTERPQLVAALVVVAYAALAATTRRAGLEVLWLLAAAAGTTWWLGFAVSGLGEAVDHTTWRALWLDGHGYPFVVAALLLLLPLLVDRTHDALVRALVTVAVAMLTFSVSVPALDEGVTALALAGLATLAVWTVVAVATPTSWRSVPVASMALGALPLAGVVLVLAPEAAANALETTSPFAGSLGLRLDDPALAASPWLLAVGVAALVAALLALVRRTAGRVVAGIATVAAGAVGTLALHPVPIWVVAAALALIGVALAAVRRGPVEAGAAGAFLLAAGIIALPSAGLTALVAALVVAIAVAVRWRGEFDGAEEAGGLVLPVAAGALVWSALAATGVSAAWSGVPVLMVVGLLAIVLAAPEVEVGACAAGLVAAAGAVAAAGDPTTSLAVHLTVAGALVTASALVHPDRRLLGWPGGALLAAATWVRLADLGVQAPEPYTLPSAAALIVLGLVQLHRNPTASTRHVLGPGLVLATVPSLLWVLVDPVSSRAVLLGGACLTLALVGTRLRWSAPLVGGSAVGAVLVLRELAPYAATVPQWVLIGIAGTLLTVVGITWESRLRDVRTTADYLRQLR
ncbi:hypothetical protein ASC77_11890 [Nocardioides sp. Root1257]|uniref:SCO7613 C-terminal domain-containing membrane protein n=1 Tax=unclassified Nocardioides TaxID=2615069 RepID=UPI0006FD7B91|nr:MULTISPECIES: hypothetical protein [unclassified Nocardioides]KQW49368.1 hypothetical protein ASC77_11890 [Nocardioides sp. Root1257]KRC48542.1 hypothetical protein ASE24_11895 [Nocardioides sp. Root224]